MAGETLKEISASDLLTETLKLKNDNNSLYKIPVKAPFGVQE